jgi:hypothetical protein
MSAIRFSVERTVIALGRAPRGCSQPIFNPILGSSKTLAGRRGDIRQSNSVDFHSRDAVD